MRKGEGIFIAPALRMAMTPMRLLASAGTAMIHIPNWSPDGLLFAARADGFVFEAEIRAGFFVARRGGAELSTKLLAVQPPPAPQIPPPTILTWDPNGMRLFSTAEKHSADTPPTFVPHALVKWAQRQSIAPVDLYESPQHFYGVVAEAVAGVQQKIVETSMQDAFWDAVRDDETKGRRVPKRETEIQPTVEGLLRDVGLAKSFEVLREPCAAGGNLDFYFVGGLRAGGIVGVCMELKHAHSPKVYDGLEKQLPAYMNNKKAGFGIYGVLWFKGADFDQPSKEVHIFRGELHRRVIQGGVPISVELFDLSKPTPPSKL